MILNRSPFYYNAPYPNEFILSVDFIIEVGTGSSTTPIIEKTYSITKTNPGNDNTWLDISPFIRDLYEQVPLTTLGTLAPIVNESPIRNVLLTTVTASFVDSIGNLAPSISNKYICAEGYGYYQDGQNFETTKSILLTNNEYKGDARGFFIVPLRVYNGAPNPEVNGVPVLLNFTDDTQNYVKYLIIPLDTYSGVVTVDYEAEQITIELIEECKYPVNEVQFLNRFGVIEGVHFYKAKKESISIEKETFKNAYTNGISYDVQRHQLKDLNVKSNKSARIETGFLSEEYNATIEELLQSEYVWIDGVPMNVNTKSLELKTRSVDKLITYSIGFDYAFDEINNV